MDAHDESAGHGPQQHSAHVHVHDHVEGTQHVCGGEEGVASVGGVGDEEEDPVYVAACKEVGVSVLEAFRGEGLTVEWDGDATSCIAVKGIPEGLDRSIFRLEPEQADWVDKMSENRTLHGMPSEARCSHTCGSGVRPCPHGVYIDLEEDPDCACCH